MPHLIVVVYISCVQATEAECADVADVRYAILQYEDRRAEIGVSDIRVRRPQVNKRHTVTPFLPPLFCMMTIHTTNG